MTVNLSVKEKNLTRYAKITNKEPNRVGSLVPKTTAESFNPAACGHTPARVDTAADPKPWPCSALGIGQGASFSEIRGKPCQSPLSTAAAASALCLGLQHSAESTDGGIPDRPGGDSRICHCCVALGKLLTSLCFSRLPAPPVEPPFLVTTQLSSLELCCPPGSLWPGAWQVPLAGGWKLSRRFALPSSPQTPAGLPSTGLHRDPLPPRPRGSPPPPLPRHISELKRKAGGGLGDHRE